MICQVVTYVLWRITKQERENRACERRAAIINTVVRKGLAEMATFG